MDACDQYEERSYAYGKKLSLDEALTRLSVMNSRIRNAHDGIKANTELRQLWDAGVLFTDADSEYGSSGAAVVNEKGEVVAMHAARLIEYRGTQPGLTISLALPLATQMKNETSLELIPTTATSGK